MISTIITRKRNDSVFTRVLREEMERRDVIQIDLAKTLEVSPQYVSDVLAQRRGPFSPSGLLKLREKYHFDLCKLLTARAWTLKKIDVPHFVTYRQVEKVVGGLLNRESNGE